MEAWEMGDETKYLRPDVIFEPLVDGFYAWLHVVVPAQAAMKPSYLHSPRVHINACNNPQPRGGCFVNVDGARSGEIRDLLVSMKRDRAVMLRFADAIAEVAPLLPGGRDADDNLRFRVVGGAIQSACQRRGTVFDMAC
jgi:hypothetical protein